MFLVSTYVERNLRRLFVLMFIYVLFCILVGCKSNIDGLQSIVDNSNFIWRDLSQQELQLWYSPTDLCMLNTTNRILFPMKIRESQCANIPGGSKGCNVGLGHMGFPCYQPFSSRLHFKRGLDGFADATDRVLTQTMTVLAKLNVTLVFAGDSTTRQKVVALDCQLRRESYRNYVMGLSYKSVLPCHSQLSVHINRGRYIVPLHQIGLGPNAVHCLKDGVGGLPGEHNYLAGMYEQARRVVDQVTAGGGRVLVLANMGLWFNEAEGLHAALPGVLAWLDQVGNNRRNIAAWHETLRQHYGGGAGSGYFDKIRRSRTDAQPTLLPTTQKQQRVSRLAQLPPTRTAPCTQPYRQVTSRTGQRTSGRHAHLSPLALLCLADTLPAVLAPATQYLSVHVTHSRARC